MTEYIKREAAIDEVLMGDISVSQRADHDHPGRGGMNMGVYIKGMEMPPNCSECAFCGYYGNGEHMCDIIQKAVEYESAKTSRREDCPLASIQPHGDLIDRDALAERFWDGQCYFTDAIKSKLQTAPTIIPASEEGE